MMLMLIFILINKCKLINNRKCWSLLFLEKRKIDSLPLVYVATDRYLLLNYQVDIYGAGEDSQLKKWKFGR